MAPSMPTTPAGGAARKAALLKPLSVLSKKPNKKPSTAAGSSRASLKRTGSPLQEPQPHPTKRAAGSLSSPTTTEPEVAANEAIQPQEAEAHVKEAEEPVKEAAEPVKEAASKDPQPQQSPADVVFKAAIETAIKRIATIVAEETYDDIAKGVEAIIQEADALIDPDDPIVKEGAALIIAGDLTHAVVKDIVGKDAMVAALREATARSFKKLAHKPLRLGSKFKSAAATGWVTEKKEGKGKGVEMPEMEKEDQSKGDELPEPEKKGFVWGFSGF